MGMSDAILKLHCIIWYILYCIFILYMEFLSLFDPPCLCKYRTISLVINVYLTERQSLRDVQLSRPRGF